MRWAHKVSKSYFVGCFAAFSAVILWSYQPPLFMDYPDWVYQGVLFGKLLSGHPVAGYVLKTYPVPNTITTVGIGLLSLIFGWTLAAKLWVVLYLSVACATCLYVGKTLQVREQALWWILPGVLFFSRAFGLGTVNFDLGVCLFLLLLCALYREEERGGILGTLVVLIFFTHFIAYAAAFLITVLFCFHSRRWKPLYIAAMTLPLAVWYAIGRTMATDNESVLGSSPTLHLLPLFLAGTIFLTAFTFLSTQLRFRILVSCLLFFALCIALGASATIFWNSHGRPSRLQNAAILLQDKLADPLGFGFFSIVEKPSIVPELSLCRAQGSNSLLVTAFCCAAIAGVLIVIAGARLLGQAEAKTEKRILGTEFILEFSALMALFYLLCPPNALGVVGLDLRLGQLALAPILFLLARDRTSLLRWSAVMVLVLTFTNLYQFAEWQRGVRLSGTLANLPPAFARCCNIDPWVRLKLYDHLRSGVMNDPIFPTGIFIDRTDSHGESKSR